MLIRQLLLIAAGASYGLLSAAGVFTVLVAVGLIPRFAGKTHTAHYVLLYEEMVIFGRWQGVSLLFSKVQSVGELFAGAVSRENEAVDGNRGSGTGSLRIISGMFIGCLALAIAEMLDSIPILREGFRSGMVWDGRS